MTFAIPEDLETPALVVDVDVLERNIATMAERMRERGVRLRPHAKTHKCHEVASRQLEQGAAGLTVASLGEAEAFAARGFEDLFVAYPLLAHGPKAARLRSLLERVRLSVGVDSLESARLLAEAAGSELLTVLVEIDSGLRRTGVSPEAAGDLARACGDLGLDVAGVFTHAGHSYREPSAPAVVAIEEHDALAAASESLRLSGVPARTVSAGSTPTALRSASAPVNEERPGTYVFNDRQQVGLGSATDDQVALVVASTVVSTAVTGQVVIDAGSKALTSDKPAWLNGHGAVVDLDGVPVGSLNECHGMVAIADGPPPPLGTVVRVVPNHVCTVVNLFDTYEVVSNGKLVDRWPVTARGHLI
jgi:D-serine deaminase-like pyridoxal phosphate-dependent protein